MANILDQYGIKEVADVTLYKINTDGSKGAPVLFLDTLKVSTIEQAAEQTEAKGGKGNSPLIIWDYGKEITVTLEDALFSPKSMAVMFGDSTGVDSLALATSTIAQMKRLPAGYVKPTDAAAKYWNETMTVSSTASTSMAFVEETYGAAQAYTIAINANSFPGTYYLVGDTYARNKTTGEDEFFQFIIPQAKMGGENTITLEAEGDPTVFNMTMRVLRPTSGAMMQLVKYTL